MAEDTKAAPAVAPAAPLAPGANPVQPQAPLSREQVAVSTANAEAKAAESRAAAGDARTVKRGQPSSSLITNPKPAVDPDAPIVEPKLDESTLPEATRREIEAGRKGLGIKAPEGSSEENLKPTNPVDAVKPTPTQPVFAKPAPKV